MTAKVIEVLKKIQDSDIFSTEIYFAGGTALSYFLNHRVSEDIDIICVKTLDYKNIIPAMQSLGAMKIKDEYITALRMAGLFPDEYMLKFILDDVKIEFFQANRAVQQEILQDAKYSYYQDSKLKILDVKPIAQLKLVAFLQREKSRDLYDFGAIVENKILTLEEILAISDKIHHILTLAELTKYIKSKKEPREDESVYLTQENRVNLSFEEIKQDILKKIENAYSEK